ncbi:uncharacterized protein METZ01_LOCUS13204 [marine metagenome]|uniref:Uncharacterized protein n=1 Tax=marine metagenome TaxID=408172 RepID=A0A381P0I9_9ZZZZ
MGRAEKSTNILPIILASILFLLCTFSAIMNSNYSKFARFLYIVRFEDIMLEFLYPSYLVKIPE